MCSLEIQVFYLAQTSELIYWKVARKHLMYLVSNVISINIPTIPKPPPKFHNSQSQIFNYLCILK